jgi:uncharacterized membrane protein
MVSGMVNTRLREDSDDLCLTLAPNYSLSRQAQDWMSALLMLLFVVLSCVFFSAGAWLVIPFVGLELLALMLMIQVVRRHCSQQERVFFDANAIRVEKQCGQQSCCWGFDRQRCSLILVHDETHSLHHVTLAGEAGLVELGGFLTESDLAAVIACMESQGVKRRHGAQWAVRAF